MTQKLSKKVRSMMKLTAKSTRAVIVLPLVFLAINGAAAEYEGRENEAWAHAGDVIDGTMSEFQKSKLLYLAYHGAADLICEDLAIDRVKFDLELATMQHEQDESLSDEEHAFYHDRVLIHYGLAVGIMLAEHAGEKESFCKEAVSFRDDPAEETLFDTTTDADYEPEEDGSVESAN